MWMIDRECPGARRCLLWSWTCGTTKETETEMKDARVKMVVECLMPEDRCSVPAANSSL